MGRILTVSKAPGRRKKTAPDLAFFRRSEAMFNSWWAILGLNQ
jgi:hypothetical protein